MRRSLPVLLTLVLVAPAAAAEIGVRSKVPMDRVPCELAEPRLIAPTEWFDAPHIPIDHPYWWTLTDEITPAELKGRLQRRVAAERQRLQDEIERRAAGESSSEEPLRRSWELRGTETPELFPVWTAFDSLARGHSIRPEYTLQELIGFGISPEAARQIVLAAEESWASDMTTKISEAQYEFGELSDWAEEEIGREALWETKRMNDFARFSELVGWSQESLRDLVRVAHCNWRAAASVPVLVKLREEIGEQQWDIFRRYLLERFASTTAQLYILDENGAMR